MNEELPQKVPGIEDVVPVKMIEIDGRMEVAAIENETFNGKNLINTYLCERCHYAIATVDRHVGTTPMKILCVLDSCDGEMVSAGYRHRRHIATWSKPVEFEWFRPLSEQECQDFRRSVHADAERIISTFYAHADVATKDLVKLAVCQEQASFVLRGGLIKRPFIPQEGDQHVAF